MTEIKDMMEDVETYFAATNVVIKTMSDGGRKQIKEIAEEVSLSLKEEVKKVLPFVNHFLHNIEKIGYVSRGKNGGFIKGVKVIKAPKAAATLSQNMTDSNS